MLEKFQNKSIKDIHLYISHFFDHFIMLIFAKTAYDAAIYFNTSYEDVIGYGALGFVLFGAVSPISARLSEYYSRSLLMVVFHFGIGFSALIASFSQSLWQLMIALGFLGAFASIYHPVGIALLLKNPNKVGLRLGINGVFGNMGVAAAPLVAGALLLFGDWRTGFWVSGFLCLIYGVIFALSLVEKEPKEYLGVYNEKKLGFLEGWQRALFSLAMCATAGGFIFGAMTFLVPRYFEIYMSNLSTSVMLTGLLASVVYAIASFSQVAIGWLIDRVSPKSVLIAMSIGQI
ncbi:MAG: MFS transporter, partial [Paracoccaceae bacterium]|nr:MFS transporter [Paracoccaceae bacterium]